MLVEEAVEEVSALPQSEVDELRQRARESLYFLSVGILGYPDVNPATHGEFCQFVQGDHYLCFNEDGSRKLRRLGLMPRGHLKSTIATVADSIRLALKNPDDARILIASETATLAEKFLLEIKSHFEKNQLLRMLFPEVLPPRFSGPGVQWSATQASLKRKSTHKDPTWQAVGVGGALTGAHFTRIKCDDLIGFEAIRSPAKMQEAKLWVEYVEPFLIDDYHDLIDYIGTRWSKNDLYARVMEYYKGALSVFTRGAIENGERIFPQKHSWEKYRRIQEENPALWHAQYENNPLSSTSNDLAWEAVRRFQFSKDGEWVLFHGGRWHLSELDVVVSTDTNSGSLTAPDEAAISVQGTSPEDHVFQLDTWNGRVDPTDFIDQIYLRARRWRARAVGTEKAGQQNTRHYFEKKCKENNYHVLVVDLEPRQRKKEDRIRFLLGPTIKSGRYFILPSQTTLNQQGADFPDTVLIDLLDAAAYGREMGRQPDRKTKEACKNRESLVKKLLARRSARTGY
jgi:hypothetical protein